MKRARPLKRKPLAVACRTAHAFLPGLSHTITFPAFPDPWAWPGTASAREVLRTMSAVMESAQR